MSEDYVDPNWPNPGGPGDSRIIIYGFTPSAALSILASVLFGLSALIHSYQLYRYRSYYFSVPVVIGAVMEVVGYIFRTLSAEVDPYRTVWFIVQYFFIVVAPVLFSASIYAVLSALINKIGRQYSPVFTPRVIIVIFVTCDVVATIVQVAGAALIGVSESNRESPVTANNILLAGLAFQVFSFLCYLVLLAIFLWRTKGIVGKETKIFLPPYLVATLLIYLRTCFRLAETAEGVFGYLMTHEVFFGCLEFAPVVLAVYLLNIWHPGKWVVKSSA